MPEPIRKEIKKRAVPKGDFNNVIPAVAKWNAGIFFIIV